MKTPLIVIDNFLENPDRLREFANKLEYNADEQFMWPGKRTDCLSVLNPAIYKLLCEKVLSLIYDFDSQYPSYKADVKFYKTDNSIKGGWVHTDYPRAFTFMLYLSPEAELEEGTSLVRPISSLYSMHDLTHDASLIKQSYLDNNLELVEKYRKELNNKFEETMKINNVYNRLIIFDSTIYHRANDFISTPENPRLTLIGFFDYVSSNKDAINRAKSLFYI